VESPLPVVSTFNAEALAEYFDEHPDALHEMSQYISEHSPLFRLRGKVRMFSSEPNSTISIN